jgi:hypothetical protein
MKIFGVNRSWIEDNVPVILVGIIAEVQVSAADLIAPATDKSYFNIPFHKCSQAVLSRSIGKPYGIIEIINDTLAKDKADQPLDYGRAYGRTFTVDENKIV